MSLEKLQRCHRCPSIVVGVLSFEKERKKERNHVSKTCPLGHIEYRLMAQSLHQYAAEA